MIVRVDCSYLNNRKKRGTFYVTLSRERNKRLANVGRIALNSGTKTLLADLSSVPWRREARVYLRAREVEL
jgi:hypothetical protein